MNQAQLVAHIAEQADLSHSSAARALEAALAGIALALVRGDAVTLAGFGTFTPRQRGERVGRHPKTGAALTIAPSTNIGFKAGKGLRDAINSPGSSGPGA